jgi:hypothetical protein
MPNSRSISPVPASTSGTGGGDNHQHRSSERQHHHAEDRLHRTWKNVSSSVIIATNKAEVAGAETSKQTLKELDDATLSFLRNRAEWLRTISYLETKLEGKEAEMENFQQYVRCQPGFRGTFRKRKREEGETQPGSQASGTDASFAS